MTATGSHFDFDSLRGAPLARNDIVLFGHFAILRQLLFSGSGLLFPDFCGRIQKIMDYFPTWGKSLKDVQTDNEKIKPRRL